MKLKHLALAAAVAVASSGAWADDYNYTAALTSSTAYFGVSHFADGMFTDTFTFTGGPAFAETTASLITIALAPGVQDITFTAADLNGNALTFVAAGQADAGYGAWSSLAGPTFVLTVTGMTTGNPASYSGTLNVTPVPEPGTYALMLAGLGAVGFIAKRRKSV